jgi:hypothetical protein
MRAKPPIVETSMTYALTVYQSPWEDPEKMSNASLGGSAVLTDRSAK